MSTKPQTEKPRRSPGRRLARDETQMLRRQLVWLLAEGNAHTGFDDAVANLPSKLRGARPPDCPHSMWRLLEHLRIAQWDILEFCRNSQHASPPWPDGYWPTSDAPPNPAAWERSLRTFHAELKAMQRMVLAPSTNLFAPIPHGQGQNVLREALLLADHNAYHVGQMVLLRRLLGAWNA